MIHSGASDMQSRELAKVRQQIYRLAGSKAFQLIAYEVRENPLMKMFSPIQTNARNQWTEVKIQIANAGNITQRLRLSQQVISWQEFEKQPALLHS